MRSRILAAESYQEDPLKRRSNARKITYSTVSSGSAVPLFVKCSKPAKRSINSGLGMSDPSAVIATLAAYP